MKKQQHILIGEDEKPMARALGIKLEHEGYKVTITHDGIALLGALEKEKNIDLVLLDLVMPKKDGFSVLEEMSEKKYEIPVIVTSNLSQDTDVKRAKKLGATDFMVKSNSSLADIITKIKSILSS